MSTCDEMLHSLPRLGHAFQSTSSSGRVPSEYQKTGRNSTTKIRGTSNKIEADKDRSQVRHYPG